MATNISDEEMRTKLMRMFPSEENIPPITESTRATLLKSIVQIDGNDEKRSVNSTQLRGDAKPTTIPVGPNPIGKKNINTLVFFDLETTGLPSDTFTPRITELSFRALDVNHFRLFDKYFLDGM